MSLHIRSPVILVVGRNGQIGWELQRSLRSYTSVVAVDRTCMDLSNNQSIINCIRGLRPDIIVNAAAYTDVNKAEEEVELAMQVNGVAPGIMAEEARKLGALLIHYSTDYVFDGSKQTPYEEIDEPSPINEYGRSKLAGEKAIQLSGCKYVIFRTSWVYSGRRENFLLTMLRLMNGGGLLKVVNDQYGSPTWAKHIADASSKYIGNVLCKEMSGGLFHLTSSGSVSWYDFSVYILKQRAKIIDNGYDSVTIKSILSTEYLSCTVRPANSILSNNKIKHTHGLRLPDWKEGVDQCLVDLLSKV